MCRFTQAKAGQAALPGVTGKVCHLWSSETGLSHDMDLEATAAGLYLHTLLYPRPSLNLPAQHHNL